MWYPLSFWKRWRWQDKNFLRCKKRSTTIVNVDSLRFALCSGVSCFDTHLAYNFLNNRSSMKILCNKKGEIFVKWLLAQLTIGAMLCAFKKFITNRTSQSAGAGIRASIFNCCNNATVRTLEVPLMHESWRRHYYITYTKTLYPINGLIAVRWVENLLCGCPS